MQVLQQNVKARLLPLGISYLVTDSLLDYRSYLSKVQEYGVIIMDPLTMAATAIAATIMTKFWEKTGEKLSEELFEKSEQFYKSLKNKAPETASAIEKIPQAPAEYGQTVLEVKAIAESDVELVEEMQTLATTAQQEPNETLQQVIREILYSLQNQQPSVQNLGKVADKIGLLVQGGTVNIQNFSVN